jgi:hypothetical protein
MPNARSMSKSMFMTRRLAFGLALLVCAGASAAHARPKTKHALPPPPAAASDKSSDSNEDATSESELPPTAATPTSALQPVQPSAAGNAKPETTRAALNAQDKSTVVATNDNAATEKLAGLRADVTSLMDDLVEARSRAAMLGKTLFKTQVRVRVQNLAAPDPVLVKVVLKLDGAPIYRGDAAALSGDDTHQVFESFIAPGAHVLSAEIEQRSRDNAAYGYTLHETYKFQALREKRSELTLILDDDSDLAGDFPSGGAGEYDVRTKLRVKSKNLNDE